MKTVMDFHRFIIRIRQEENFLLSQIRNMDQKPLNFDMPCSMTVEKTSARTMHIRMTGAERQVMHSDARSEGGRVEAATVCGF